MRWIWVRHGETEENRLRRYLGHADPPLNERGKEQAERLRRLLADLSPAAVYSSDLTRCMETATRIAAQWKLRPIPVQSLRELSFGKWDGKTYDEIMRTDGERMKKWYDNPFQVSPPGGETLEQFGRRIDNWLSERLAAFQSDETVLIVSHGGVIRWFECKWLARDPSSFWRTEGLGHGQALFARWDGQRWMTSLLEEEGSDR
jgi:alpha-ribazole phosphatase